jgi:hypothetical protein
LASGFSLAQPTGQQLLGWWPIYPKIGEQELPSCRQWRHWIPASRRWNRMGECQGGSLWGRELIWDMGKVRGSPVRALYGGGSPTEELIGGRSNLRSLALSDRS